ncbi:MAG: hypothetical protein VW362_03460 [Candidatus Nanopelagicales bacterium]
MALTSTGTNNVSGHSITIDSVNATATEVNNICDRSAAVQAIAVAGAITVDGSIDTVEITGSGGGYAITLAAPSAAMEGRTLTLNYVGGDTDAVTLALTNVQGGSAATTASFNATDETLILVGGKNKWNVVKEIGVSLT